MCRSLAKVKAVEGLGRAQGSGVLGKGLQGSGVWAFDGFGVLQGEF